MAREVLYGFIFALKNVMFCSLIITGWEGQPGMVQSMSGPAKEIFEQNRELYGSESRPGGLSASQGGLKVSQWALRASQTLRAIYGGGGPVRGSESQLGGGLKSAEGARGQARKF